MRIRSLTQLSRALARRLVGGILWSSNPSSSTVAAVLRARDRHVLRARRGRGQHRSRGGYGVSIRPGIAGVVGPRGGGEDPRTPRRRLPNLVSRGMGQLVRTCQRYRLRELPPFRSHGDTAPCDAGGVMADTAYP